jgi:hypothetical protein
VIRIYLKSLVVGLGAALVAGAIWTAVGVTRVTSSSFTASAPPETAKPNEAVPAGASDDMQVTTTDSIVSMTTTTHTDPAVAWIALAALLFTSTWTLRRLRTRGTPR